MKTVRLQNWRRVQVFVRKRKHSPQFDQSLGGVRPHQGPGGNTQKSKRLGQRKRMRAAVGIRLAREHGSRLGAGIQQEPSSTWHDTQGNQMHGKCCTTSSCVHDAANYGPASSNLTNVLAPSLGGNTLPPNSSSSLSPQQRTNLFLSRTQK
jgi:hypothetical protein